MSDVKQTRGNAAKTVLFPKWGKLWKGISSKEYRLRCSSKIEFRLYGRFLRVKLWMWGLSIKLCLAAGSLLIVQHNERIKLSEKTIYLGKREKLYRADPKSVEVWKKISRFWFRQGAKPVTKPDRRNPFEMRQVSNLQETLSKPKCCRGVNLKRVTFKRKRKGRASKSGSKKESKQLKGYLSGQTEREAGIGNTAKRSKSHSGRVKPITHYFSPW